MNNARVHIYCIKNMHRVPVPRGMDVYFYTCDGVPDTNWGCVYRSLQNAFAATHRHVPSMHYLMHMAREQRAAFEADERSRARRPVLPALPFPHVDKWAEPALFRAYAHTRAFSVGRIKPRFSSLEAYRYHLNNVNELLAHINDVDQSTHAFVIDDGVSAYAIIPHEGRHCWIDPHVTSHAAVRLEYDIRSQLHKRTAWLVLEVCPLPRHPSARHAHQSHPASW